MSDPTNPPNSTDDARAEALAWLAGQFRWEALLADLHELAEQEAAPVVELDQQPGSSAAEDEDAA
jgi:hypothetical protein